MPQLSPFVLARCPAPTGQSAQRRSAWRVIGLAVLAVVCGGLALANGGRALAAPSVLGPRFEAGPCPFPAATIPTGERVDCGNLIVPEDRSQPDGAAVQ